MDLINGVRDQVYFSAKSRPVSDMVLRNNIFTNSPVQAEGSIYFQPSATGTFEMSGNRFTDGGTGNGVRFYNRESGGGTTTLDIRDNVWLDNGRWAMNLGSTAAATTTGTIANNWFGNTEANDTGAEDPSRQSGFVVTGELDNLAVEDNIYSNIDGPALYFFSWDAAAHAHGSLDFTSNLIEGYANFDSGAIRINAAGDPDVDREDVGEIDLRASKNVFTDRIDDATAILNLRPEAVTALDNWWGQETGPAAGQIVGNVYRSSWHTADDGSGWVAQETSPFTDVPANDSFFHEITWLNHSGITTGYADATFRPKNNITREAMAAFMYRLAGSPDWEAPEESPFSDIDVDHNFFREITWLADREITTGYEDGSFRPKGNITREATSAFLHRMAGAPELDSSEDAARFTDLEDSEFTAAIAWQSDHGIAKGYVDGSFRPKNQITREAMAAFVERFFTNDDLHVHVQ